MKILNLCHSSTKNTSKVAERIDQTVKQAGYEVNSLKASKDAEIDLLSYDLVFCGSGVYEWLPGKPMLDLMSSLRKSYVKQGSIKPGSPKLEGKGAILYCTYGGVHTGINEAIPAVKYMGQLFDHLGFHILAEWYVVGEYVPEKMQDFSYKGRLGNIKGRPDEHDLKEIEEKVKGILGIL